MKTPRQRRLLAVRVLLCGVACLLSVAHATTTDDPATKGQRIFDMTCSGCHGYDGQGQGELGFTLTAPEIAAWSDEELADKIRYGNLERGMPRFADIFLAEGQMTDFGNFQERVDFRAVTAYIRVLQQRASQADDPFERPSTQGTATAGQALFNGKARCATCHISREGGPRVAPNLVGLGARLERDVIYKSIVDPSLSIHPDFRRKELRLPRGKVVQGRFRNETSDRIEILDENQNSWTVYEKKDVLFYRTLRVSAMPEGLLDLLEESERSDLLAYLDSL